MGWIKINNKYMPENANSGIKKDTDLLSQMLNLICPTFSSINQKYCAKDSDLYNKIKEFNSKFNKTNREKFSPLMFKEMKPFKAFNNNVKVVAVASEEEEEEEVVVATINNNKEDSNNNNSNSDSEITKITICDQFEIKKKVLPF